MDIIQSARELGKQLQKEDSYIRLMQARDRADADMSLQQDISTFNQKRYEINDEASKKDRNADKMSQLNREMREAYSRIMSNENMTAYNEAKDEFDLISNRVLAIIRKSAEGEDPETADYYESSGCSGSCASCSGCG